MKDSPHHRNHLKKKAIREANAMKDSGALPKEMIENPNFKKQFDAKESSLPHKPDKQTKQKSKRTSAREVTHETEPDSIHTENAKWNHVLQTQTQEKNLLLNKKLSKHKK
jgi:hypothetical protein